MKTWTTKAVAATALMVVTLLAASGAEATLFTRLNGQAVYDDQANLTWLQDANYAQTSGYDDDGLMIWTAAMDWAAGLSIEGVKGWRLPGGPFEYDFVGHEATSEMGDLYYNSLGGGRGDLANIHNANYALFKNILTNYYWSGVEWSNDPPDYRFAWAFNMGNGYMWPGMWKTGGMWAWAVHDGDVEASAVPAPGTLALLGAGLLGWVGVKRARRARA